MPTILIGDGPGRMVMKRAIIARRYLDARHRALAGTVCRLQHVGCRSQRRIAGHHDERQRLPLQDACKRRGRRRVDADRPNLDAISAVDLERAVGTNDRLREVTVPATDDEIAAVGCNRKASDVARPSASGQRRVARLGRRLGAGSSQQTDKTGRDHSRQPRSRARRRVVIYRQHLFAA